MYLSSARYILRRGRVLLLLERPLKWRYWEGKRGYTSAVEGPHSHHHLDVPSTCWRHLCVCSMPLLTSSCPEAMPLLSRSCPFLNNVLYPKVDSTGLRETSLVVESSSPHLRIHSNHTVHARCRESSVQGIEMLSVPFVIRKMGSGTLSTESLIGYLLA